MQRRMLLGASELGESEDVVVDEFVAEFGLGVVLGMVKSLAQCGRASKGASLASISGRMAMTSGSRASR
jgi:hypothetical protein